jgi:nanoRNase/pAp phosphatase (c-di-AMP/oligoRNAs hydrolase)
MSTARQRKTHDKLQKLCELLHGKSTLLIVMQDHPDPDAVASAAALRRIANACDVNCTLVHGGMVGRAENRALVDYLGLNLRPMWEISLESFDLIALVDTQPGTGNNALPPEMVPDIVIDHHPIHKATRSVEFTDIRSGYGATATILVEYLRALDLIPSVPLATGLLYGIRSDTQDLGRRARKSDLDAYHDLAPLANLKMLAQIQHGPLPDHYYQLLHTALNQAVCFDNAIFAALGPVKNPDMTGEVADLLVRQEKMNWCLCTAQVGNTVLLSLRAREAGKDAGAVIKKVVGRRGTAGGHDLLAGGQIPLKKGSTAELAELDQWLVERFQKVLRIKNTALSPLVG